MPKNRWTDAHNLRLLIAICEEVGFKGISWAKVRRIGRLEAYTACAINAQFTKLRREARLSADAASPSPFATPRKVKSPKGVEGKGFSPALGGVQDDEENEDEDVKVKLEPEPEWNSERRKIKLEDVDENGVVLLLDSDDEGLYDIPAVTGKRKAADMTGR